MAVSLLPLSNKHYSLEFETADIERVNTTIIELYGRPIISRHATCMNYIFGGCDFTFQTEWDDPCLISDSSEGDNILKKLHKRLNL